MMVVSRKANESLIINDNIRVEVVEVRPGKVRLGITSPDCVPVHRGEVYEQIREDEEARHRERVTTAWGSMPVGWE